MKSSMTKTKSFSKPRASLTTPIPTMKPTSPPVEISSMTVSTESWIVDGSWRQVWMPKNKPKSIENAMAETVLLPQTPSSYPSVCYCPVSRTPTYGVFEPNLARSER